MRWINAAHLVSNTINRGHCMRPQRLEVRVSGHKHTKILCVTIAYQWYDARVCNIDIARAVHFQIRVDDTSLISRKHGSRSCRIEPNKSFETLKTSHSFGEDVKLSVALHTNRVP